MNDDVSGQRRAERFQQLHRRGRPFVLPNPWDVGSARLFEALGFEALATTSAGSAFAAGRLDRIGATGRDEALRHAAQIAAATALPVSADLENGYGDAPEEVAATVRAAAALGLAGCSIEDASGDRARPIYERGLAAERIRAAVEAVETLRRPFLLTARAENFLHGRRDLDDTLARLSDYQQAGAQVLYAPGLPDLQTVAEVCGALQRPVNVLPGGALLDASVDDFARCGVARISLGSAPARAALGALLQAAGEIRDRGTFTTLKRAASFAEIETLLGAAADDPR